MLRNAGLSGAAAHLGSVESAGKGQGKLSQWRPRRRSARKTDSVFGIDELDDFHAPPTNGAHSYIDLEDSGQKFGPRGALGCCPRFGRVIIPQGKLCAIVFILLWSWHHTASLLGVSCEDAVISEKMKARRWHQGTEPRYQIKRLEDDGLQVLQSRILRSPSFPVHWDLRSSIGVPPLK